MNLYNTELASFNPLEIFLHFLKDHAKMCKKIRQIISSPFESRPPLMKRPKMEKLFLLVYEFVSRVEIAPSYFVMSVSLDRIFKHSELLKSKGLFPTLSFLPYTANE